MAPQDTITESYQPTVLGPVFDDFVDRVAAKYVVGLDDEDALQYIVNRIRETTPHEAIAQDPNLDGKVEWWVRNNYSARDIVESRRRLRD